MKILAFNGSPQMKKGITEQILQPFMEGASEAGAETEIVYLSKQKIKYCSGCFSCWFKHPGKCIHNDDMLEMRQRIKTADVVVLASPVYIDGFTAQTKTLLDRLIAGGSPFIEFREGHSRHPSRGKEVKNRKLLLISTCGFGERDNFGPIIEHTKAIAGNLATFEYMGALVRPMGGSMAAVEPSDVYKVDGIMQAFRQAGRDAATKGEISQELEDAVSISLMTVKEYVEKANTLFKEMLAENKKQKE